MHVLHRSHLPHLPRLIGVSIAAAVLAIVVSLALASSLNTVNQPGGNPSTAHAALTSPPALQTTMPRWVGNPFASPLSRPLPQPWPISRP